jgi:protein phosphatase
MPTASQTDTDDFKLLPQPIPTERPAEYSSRVQVDLAARSDIGKVRPNNEDHYLVARFGRFLERLLTNLPERDLPNRSDEIGYGMIVADGMGGAAAGEVASRFAIETFINLVLNVPDWILRPEGELVEEIKRRAAERYRQVNAALVEKASAEPELYGMGTTMTLACSLGADLFLAHIGDSRAYLFHKGKLSRLTRDHTLAQELAEHGFINPEDVATNKMRHVLTQVLGTKSQELKPQVRKLQLADQDCLLLCTDGLTELVDDETIAKILERGDPAERSCERLIDLALERGGKDNVTAVLARYRLP